MGARCPARAAQRAARCRSTVCCESTGWRLTECARWRGPTSGAHTPGMGAGGQRQPAVLVGSALQVPVRLVLGQRAGRINFAFATPGARQRPAQWARSQAAAAYRRGPALSGAWKAAPRAAKSRRLCCTGTYVRAVAAPACSVHPSAAQLAEVASQCKRADPAPLQLHTSCAPGVREVAMLELLA